MIGVHSGFDDLNPKLSPLELFSLSLSLDKLVESGCQIRFSEPANEPVRQIIIVLIIVLIMVLIITSEASLNQLIIS